MRFRAPAAAGLPRSIAEVRAGLSDHRALIQNASSLFGVTLITAGFGAVFWAIAARTFPTASVGLAAAAISAMQLLAQASTLGLGTILIGELPRHRGAERSLILSALGINLIVGGVLALAFGLLAGTVVPELRPLASPRALLVFSAGVAFTAAGLVLDQAFIGLLRGVLQVIRNATASLLKLVALAAVALVIAVDRGGIVLFGTWIIGSIVSMALVVRLPRPVGTDRTTIWRSTDGLAPLAIRHHLFNLSIYAPGLLLPLVITAVLSAEANGYFYIPYLVASFGFAVPAAMATALYAVGVRDVAGLVTRIRFAFGLCVLVAIAAAVGSFVAGGAVLSVFGPGYASRAELLQLFALGILPVTVNSLYVPIARLEGRFVEGTVLMLLSMVIELAVVITVARLDGLEGSAVGWLIGYSLGVLPFVPALWRVAVRGEVRPREVERQRDAQRRQARVRQPVGEPERVGVMRRALAASRQVTEAPSWNVGLIDLPIERLASGGRLPAVRWLPERRGHFAADPFGIEVGDSTHLLYEDFDQWHGRGTIAHVELRPDGSMTEPETVLDPGCHVSYPFLIPDGDTIWMLPETADLAELRLYRAVDFPRRWEVEAILLPGVQVSDPTVLRHEDRWWLFGTSRGRGVNRALRLWHAPSLTGPWTRHVSDPVKDDPASARPGGTPFISDGRLFRPAQDSSERYGARIVINEIEVLTPDGFEEQVVATVEPDPSGRYRRGLHTLSSVGARTLIDGNATRFVPQAIVGSVRARLGRGPTALEDPPGG